MANPSLSSMVTCEMNSFVMVETNKTHCYLSFDLICLLNNQTMETSKNFDLINTNCSLAEALNIVAEMKMNQHLNWSLCPSHSSSMNGDLFDIRYCFERVLVNKIANHKMKIESIDHQEANRSHLSNFHLNSGENKLRMMKPKQVLMLLLMDHHNKFVDNCENLSS